MKIKTAVVVAALLASAALLSLATPQASAQAVYGSIIGTITDPQGAAVAGAKVVATSVRKGTSEEATTNADGNFRFAGDSYIFNLQTTGLATGVYNLYFRVGADPALHAVQFQIK